MRSTLAALLLLSALSTPAPAQACDASCAVALLSLGGFGGVVLGLGSLGVLGEDLSVAMRGRWLSADLAIGNLVLGAVDIAAGLGFAFGVDGDHALAWGLGFASAGLLMIVDGALSLALRPDDEAERPLGLALSGGPDGAQIGLRGRF